MLIEHPNFHAAERTTLLIFRTKTKAYYFESVQSDHHSESEIEKRTHRQEISLETYAQFHEKASSWKQLEDLQPIRPVDGFRPEFWGVTSIFSEGSCRQIILGMEDFMSCKTEDCKPPLDPGKVMEALSPILDKITY